MSDGMDGKDYYEYLAENTDALRERLEELRLQHKQVISAVRGEHKHASEQVRNLIRAVQAWVDEISIGSTAIDEAEMGLSFCEEALESLDAGDSEPGIAFIQAHEDMLEGCSGTYTEDEDEEEDTLYAGAPPDLVEEFEQMRFGGEDEHDDY
jgi:hypothetical protein